MKPPDEMRETLREVAISLEKSAEYWRTNPADPHNINTAVYVSLLEFANAIRRACSDTLKEPPPTPVEPRRE